jgi:hypothetical protein
MSRDTPRRNRFTCTHPVSATWTDETPVVVTRFDTEYWCVSKAGCPKYGNSEPTQMDSREYRSFETTTVYGTTFGETVEHVDAWADWTVSKGPRPERVQVCVCTWCSPKHGPDAHRTWWGGVNTAGDPRGYTPENAKGPKTPW